MSKTKAMHIGCLALLLIALPLVGACGEKEVVKEVVKEVPVEKEVVKEVVKEVPVEKVVVKEVPVEKVVVKEVPVEQVKEPAGPKLIRIGAITALSGPVINEVTQWAKIGADDYYRYVNEENLLPGIELEVLWRDDQFVPAKTMLRYKELKAKGVDILELLSGTQCTVLKSTLAREMVPGVSWGSCHAAQVPPGWTFSTQGTFDAYFLAFLDWIHEHWDYEEMGRNPRVVASVTELEYGKEIIEPGKVYAPMVNVDLVLAETFSPYGTDFNPYVARAKEANPDFVYASGMGIQHPGWIKEAYRQGITPPTQIWAPIATYWPIAPNLSVIGPELSPYTYVLAPCGLFSEDKPGINLARSVLHKYHAGEEELVEQIEQGFEWWVGWSTAATITEAIRIAAKDVGVENVDSVALYRALQKLDLDMEGPVPTITFGPEKRYGMNDVRVFRGDKEGRSVEAVSDWIKVKSPAEIDEIMKKSEG